MEICDGDVSQVAYAASVRQKAKLHWSPATFVNTAHRRQMYEHHKHQAKRVIRRVYSVT
jgi:hypothetical protein